MKTRKKSINNLVDQLNRFINTAYFLRAYFAYKSSFNKRFGFDPHTKQCADFIKKYTKDFQK